MERTDLQNPWNMLLRKESKLVAGLVRGEFESLDGGVCGSKNEVTSFLFCVFRKMKASVANSNHSMCFGGHQSVCVVDKEPQ